MTDGGELSNNFCTTMDTASLVCANLWTYLSENCLHKSDQASTIHSLEIRGPRLGQLVLDAVSHLPSSVHYDKDGGKAILRQFARNSWWKQYETAKNGDSRPPCRRISMVPGNLRVTPSSPTALELRLSSMQTPSPHYGGRQKRAKRHDDWTTPSSH